MNCMDKYACYEPQPLPEKVVWLLGKVDAHCELINKGVREVALVSPYWTDEQHKLYYGRIRKVARSYELKTLAHAESRKGCDSITKRWVYYLYAPDANRKLNELVAAFERVSEKPNDKATHRKIGRLLRYSRVAIEKRYGKAA